VCVCVCVCVCLTKFRQAFRRNLGKDFGNKNLEPKCRLISVSAKFWFRLITTVKPLKDYVDFIIKHGLSLARNFCCNLRWWIIDIDGQTRAAR
jgi:hypothetical protein